MQLKQVETVYDTAGKVIKVIQTTVNEDTETKSDIKATTEEKEQEKLIDKSETVAKVKKNTTFAFNLSIGFFIVCLVFGVIYYVRKRLLV
jgi:cell division protein FtsX